LAAKGVSKEVGGEKLHLKQVLFLFRPEKAILEHSAGYCCFKANQHKVLALIGKLESCANGQWL